MRLPVWTALLVLAPMARAQDGDDAPPSRGIFAAVHSSAIDEVVEVLLHARANRDVCDAGGKTPLDYAIAGDFTPVIDLLR